MCVFIKATYIKQYGDYTLISSLQNRNKSLASEYKFISTKYLLLTIIIDLNPEYHRNIYFGGLLFHH